MRDILSFCIDDLTELVISTDSSGGIGLKKGDLVNVSDDIVGYYTARVALMENLSVGGEPFAMTIQNFTGDHAWIDYNKGVERAVKELSLPPIPILGSSETNFSLDQSGFGITVIGKRVTRRTETQNVAEFAVIGTPLVGEDVIVHSHLVIPLSVFNRLLTIEGIFEIVPIGSKGVFQEWQLLCVRNQLPWVTCQSSDTISLSQSSGPATSVLISYDPEKVNQIKKITGAHFHPLSRM